MKLYQVLWIVLILIANELLMLHLWEQNTEYKHMFGYQEDAICDVLGYRPSWAEWQFHVERWEKSGYKKWVKRGGVEPVWRKK